MTTSSSETSRGSRCTRISPSAILDDRLTGRDLDWARDHLRRCDTCRERIDDFQDMRLRLDRLSHPTIAASAIEDAFLAVVPNAARPLPSQARVVAPPVPVDDLVEVSTVPTSEVASVPDLLSQLEHEIFRDRPWGEHPEAMHGSLVPSEDEVPRRDPDITYGHDEIVTAEPLTQEVEDPSPAWERLREVEVASSAPPVDAPIAEPAVVDALENMDQPSGETPTPAVEPEATHPARRSPNDTAMRLGVGLGAAACVLLAAVLYESGWFPTGHPTAATAAHASAAASTRPATASPTVRASVATPAPTPTPPPVLATLGDGVAGESVFRIRPGTAVAGWTRLVFDLTGTGLPTMVIAQPDPLHLRVTFQNTTGASTPVGGIHSPQVQGIEAPIQDGSDLVFTVDLAVPCRLTDFTLPPASGYAPRLVLDMRYP